MKVNPTLPPNSSGPNGFILIDKPVGPTSFQVVATIRRLLSPKDSKRRLKVGHAGTLDPLASGLLIIAVGKATKEIHKFVGLDKTYETTITLGATTETDDAEAEPIVTPNAQPPTLEKVEQAVKSFIGEQMQTPPLYSAKKQDGVRLYKLARSGKTTDVKSHKIIIHDITVLSYTYPSLTIRVRCGSGTYIRSLARDIGAQLNVGGYVNRLRRTAIGSHTTENTITNYDDLTIISKELTLNLP